MMAKNPDDRFQTMTELVKGLDALDLFDEVDPETIATLDMPDDGSGGFIQIPDEDDSEIPQSDQTFVTPDRLTSKLQQAIDARKLAVQPTANDATVLEPEKTAFF
jgi:hypothetical protein